jgi:hypothetical protein
MLQKLTPIASHKYALVFIAFLLIASCKKSKVEVKVITPALTTTIVTNVSANSAVSGGLISNDGGAAVSARGVVWSTSPNPDILLSTKTTDGPGAGSFTSVLTNLSAGTKYYCRAYAVNSVGTSYGSEINFTTTQIINGLPAPPASLGLSTFYKKYLDASGIPIVSSASVPDQALYNVQKIINKMVSLRSDVLAKMIEKRVRVGIMAKTEVTTNMPEHSDLNTAFPGTNWNQYRGLGATVQRPLSSCAEENVLCYGVGNDIYYNEDIFIHEFAHTFHIMGIRFADVTIDNEIQQTYSSAIANNLWANTYAGTNYQEYFAEGVQCWFNVNAQAIPANGIHNFVNTRAELQAYDIGLYNIIKRYFVDDAEIISCH